MARTARIQRTTKETQIELELVLDGTGKYAGPRAAEDRVVGDLDVAVCPGRWPRTHT